MHSPNREDWTELDTKMTWVSSVVALPVFLAAHFVTSTDWVQNTSESCPRGSANDYVECTGFIFMHLFFLCFMFGFGRILRHVPNTPPLHPFLMLLRPLHGVV